MKSSTSISEAANASRINGLLSCLSLETTKTRLFFLMTSPLIPILNPHELIYSVGLTWSIRLNDESESRVIVSKVQRSRQLVVPLVAFFAIAASDI